MTEETKLSDIHPHDIASFYMFEAVTEDMSLDFLFFVDKMNSFMKKGEINFYINSPGGNAFDGFAMYDAMRKSKHKFNTHLHGLIGSAATFTAVAGNYREMDRNALLMVHQHSGYSGGKMHELESGRKVDRFVYDTMVDIYTKHSSLSKAKVKSTLMGASDVWLTAKEALKYGLVDKVV